MLVLNFQQNFYLLFLMLIVCCACKGQDQSTRATPKKDPTKSAPYLLHDIQIAEYIRNIYEDKNGHLWFGTNGRGVAHFDGVMVTYYSIEEGFNGQQITGITTDKDQNLWFATNLGVVKYDWTSNHLGGKHFINFPSDEYFGEQQLWSIYADKSNNIWTGGAKGIFKFNGQKWSSFELPIPDKFIGDFITGGTTWSILEDSKGSFWFSTNGYGVYKYDGKSFTQYSKKDGLTDNSVDNILEDSKGNIWLGTRHGGISRYDGKSFTNYTSKDSIGNDEVCVIYEDAQGNIWLSSEGYGVYKYDGTSFTNYGQNQGLEVRAVQTIYEDRKGRLWVGGGGGLYRLTGERFINVTKNGPWK